MLAKTLGKHASLVSVDVELSARVQAQRLLRTVMPNLVSVNVLKTLKLVISLMAKPVATGYAKR